MSLNEELSSVISDFKNELNTLQDKFNDPEAQQLEKYNRCKRRIVIGVLLSVLISAYIVSIAIFFVYVTDNNQRSLSAILIIGGAIVVAVIFSMVLICCRNTNEYQEYCRQYIDMSKNIKTLTSLQKTIDAIRIGESNRYCSVCKTRLSLSMCYQKVDYTNIYDNNRNYIGQVASNIQHVYFCQKCFIHNIRTNISYFDGFSRLEFETVPSNQ